MTEFILSDLPKPESLIEMDKETNYVVKLGSYEEMLGLIDWTSKARSHMQLDYGLHSKPDVYAYGDLSLGDQDVSTMQETGIIYFKTLEELKPFIL